MLQVDVDRIKKKERVRDIKNIKKQEDKNENFTSNCTTHFFFADESIANMTYVNHFLSTLLTFDFLISIFLPLHLFDVVFLPYIVQLFLPWFCPF